MQTSSNNFQMALTLPDQIIVDFVCTLDIDFLR